MRVAPPGVTQGVGDGLLRDAEHRGIDSGRQVGDVAGDVHLDPRRLGAAACQQAEVGRRLAAGASAGAVVSRRAPTIVRISVSARVASDSMIRSASPAACGSVAPTTCAAWAWIAMADT